MDRKRLMEILKSKGFIEVKYRNNPVWLEGTGNIGDGKIQVKDLNTDEHIKVNIDDLKE